MSDHFRQRQQPEGMGHQHHLLQGAVAEIIAKQPLQGEHGSQQGRHPDDTGGNAGQQLGLGPDAERKQGDDDEEEPERIEDVGTLAQGHQQLAVNKVDYGAQHGYSCNNEVSDSVFRRPCIRVKS